MLVRHSFRNGLQSYKLFFNQANKPTASNPIFKKFLLLQIQYFGRYLKTDKN